MISLYGTYKNSFVVKLSTLLIMYKLNYLYLCYETAIVGFPHVADGLSNFKKSIGYTQETLNEFLYAFENIIGSFNCYFN